MAFAWMVGAWTVSEITRYSYFTVAAMMAVPRGLLWARYTLFYVLYPIGATTEAMMIVLSMDDVARLYGQVAYLVCVVILCAYPPGLGYMYLHMHKQRRKHLP
jgi:very-long-chain (3R)-3-hydroxyacyl-CoA dehydratase